MVSAPPCEIVAHKVPIIDLIDLECLLSKTKKYARYSYLLQCEIKLRYSEYYSTPRWKQKRKEVIERDKVCVVCHGVGEQIHHKTYKRFGHESLEDLCFVCEKCHDKFTNDDRGYRYKKKKIIIKNVPINSRGTIKGGRYENVQIQNDRLGPIAYAQRPNVGSYGSINQAD